MKKFIPFVFYFFVSFFLAFLMYMHFLRPYHLEYQVKNSHRYQSKANKIQIKNIYNSSLILLGDLIAYISFEIFEKKFLRLKAKYSKVKSSS